MDRPPGNWPVQQYLHEGHRTLPGHRPGSRNEVENLSTRSVGGDKVDGPKVSLGVGSPALPSWKMAEIASLPDPGIPGWAKSAASSAGGQGERASQETGYRMDTQEPPQKKVKNTDQFGSIYPGTPLQNGSTHGLNPLAVPQRLLAPGGSNEGQGLPALSMAANASRQSALPSFSSFWPTHAKPSLPSFQDFTKTTPDQFQSQTALPNFNWMFNPVQPDNRFDTASPRFSPWGFNGYPLSLTPNSGKSSPAHALDQPTYLDSSSSASSNVGADLPNDSPHGTPSTSTKKKRNKASKNPKSSQGKTVKEMLYGSENVKSGAETAAHAYEVKPKAAHDHCDTRPVQSAVRYRALPESTLVVASPVGPVNYKVQPEPSPACMPTDLSKKSTLSKTDSVESDAGCSTDTSTSQQKPTHPVKYSSMMSPSGALNFTVSKSALASPQALSTSSAGHEPHAMDSSVTSSRPASTASFASLDSSVSSQIIDAKKQTEQEFKELDRDTEREILRKIFCCTSLELCDPKAIASRPKLTSKTEISAVHFNKEMVSPPKPKKKRKPKKPKENAPFVPGLQNLPGSPHPAFPLPAISPGQAVDPSHKHVAAENVLAGPTWQVPVGSPQMRQVPHGSPQTPGQASAATSSEVSPVLQKDSPNVSGPESSGKPPSKQNVDHLSANLSSPSTLESVVATNPSSAISENVHINSPNSNVISYEHLKNCMTPEQLMLSAYSKELYSRIQQHILKTREKAHSPQNQTVPAPDPGETIARTDSQSNSEGKSPFLDPDKFSHLSPDFRKLLEYRMSKNVNSTKIPDIEGVSDRSSEDGQRTGPQFSDPRNLQESQHLSGQQSDLMRTSSDSQNVFGLGNVSNSQLESRSQFDPKRAQNLSISKELSSNVVSSSPSPGVLGPQSWTEPKKPVDPYSFSDEESDNFSGPHGSQNASQLKGLRDPGSIQGNFDSNSPYQSQNVRDNGKGGGIHYARDSPHIQKIVPNYAKDEKPKTERTSTPSNDLNSLDKLFALSKNISVTPDDSAIARLDRVISSVDVGDGSPQNFLNRLIDINMCNSSLSAKSTNSEPRQLGDHIHPQPLVSNMSKSGPKPEQFDPRFMSPSQRTDLPGRPSADGIPNKPDGLLQNHKTPESRNVGNTNSFSTPPYGAESHPTPPYGAESHPGSSQYPPVSDSEWPSGSYPPMSEPYPPRSQVDSHIQGNFSMEINTGEDREKMDIKMDDVTPEAREAIEQNMKLLRRLQSNSQEVPDCTCRQDDFCEKDEGPFYTQLGAAEDVPAVRKEMEQRTGYTGDAIRIEKAIYSGKEGKTTQGCPIAKWIIRRSGPEEKVLVVVRSRPGHHCKAACIIIVIVAWEGIQRPVADDLYSHLIRVLPLYGHETERRCGSNEQKTCACQGFDPSLAGASFSFGCSWSMFFNGCKFSRSRYAKKFKLKDEKEEEEIERRLQSLASDVAPVYKQFAPQAYSNQCYYDEEGNECRLGVKPGRPFSGVTSCVDFCAHAHKDLHNMNNGSTVVVTLTKHRGFEKPEDEQLHVLPLYVLDPTDEKGSYDGQREKVRTGSLEVLTSYYTMTRIRGTPKKKKKNKNSPATSKQDASSPATPKGKKSKGGGGGDQNSLYFDSKTVKEKKAKEKLEWDEERALTPIKQEMPMWPLPGQTMPFMPMYPNGMMYPYPPPPPGFAPHPAFPFPPPFMGMNPFMGFGEQYAGMMDRKPRKKGPRGPRKKKSVPTQETPVESASSEPRCEPTPGREQPKPEPVERSNSLSSLQEVLDNVHQSVKDSLNQDPNSPAHARPEPGLASGKEALDNLQSVLDSVHRDIRNSMTPPRNTGVMDHQNTPHLSNAPPHGPELPSRDIPNHDLPSHPMQQENAIKSASVPLPNSGMFGPSSSNEEALSRAMERPGSHELFRPQVGTPSQMDLSQDARAAEYANTSVPSTRLFGLVVPSEKDSPPQSVDRRNSELDHSRIGVPSGMHESPAVPSASLPNSGLFTPSVPNDANVPPTQTVERQTSHEFEKSVRDLPSPMTSQDFPKSVPAEVSASVHPMEHLARMQSTDAQPKEIASEFLHSNTDAEDFAERKRAALIEFEVQNRFMKSLQNQSNELDAPPVTSSSLQTELEKFESILQRSRSGNVETSPGLSSFEQQHRNSQNLQASETSHINSPGQQLSEMPLGRHSPDLQKSKEEQLLSSSQQRNNMDARNSPMSMVPNQELYPGFEKSNQSTFCQEKLQESEPRLGVSHMPGLTSEQLKEKAGLMVSPFFGQHSNIQSRNAQAANNPESQVPPCPQPGLEFSSTRKDQSLPQKSFVEEGGSPHNVAQRPNQLPNMVPQGPTQQSDFAPETARPSNMAAQGSSPWLNIFGQGQAQQPVVAQPPSTSQGPAQQPIGGSSQQLNTPQGPSQPSAMPANTASDLLLPPDQNLDHLQEILDDVHRTVQKSLVDDPAAKSPKAFNPEQQMNKGNEGMSGSLRNDPPGFDFGMRGQSVPTQHGLRPQGVPELPTHPGMSAYYNNTGIPRPVMSCTSAPPVMKKKDPTPAPNVSSGGSHLDDILNEVHDKVKKSVEIEEEIGVRTGTLHDQFALQNPNFPNLPGQQPFLSNLSDKSSSQNIEPAYGSLQNPQLKTFPNKDFQQQNSPSAFHQTIVPEGPVQSPLPGIPQSSANQLGKPSFQPQFMNQDLPEMDKNSIVMKPKEDLPTPQGLPQMPFDPRLMFHREVERLCGQDTTDNPRPSSVPPQGISSKFKLPSPMSYSDPNSPMQKHVQGKPPTPVHTPPPQIGHRLPVPESKPDSTPHQLPSELGCPGPNLDLSQFHKFTPLPDPSMERERHMDPHHRERDSISHSSHIEARKEQDKMPHAENINFLEQLRKFSSGSPYPGHFSPKIPMPHRMASPLGQPNDSSAGANFEKMLPFAMPKLPSSLLSPLMPNSPSGVPKTDMPGSPAVPAPFRNSPIPHAHSNQISPAHTPRHQPSPGIPPSPSPRRNSAPSPAHAPKSPWQGVPGTPQPNIGEMHPSPNRYPQENSQEEWPMNLSARTKNHPEPQLQSNTPRNPPMPEQRRWPPMERGDAPLDLSAVRPPGHETVTLNNPFEDYTCMAPNKVSYEKTPVMEQIRHQDKNYKNLADLHHLENELSEAEFMQQNGGRLPFDNTVVIRNPFDVDMLNPPNASCPPLSPHSLQNRQEKFARCSSSQDVKGEKPKPELEFNLHLLSEACVSADKPKQSHPMPYNTQGYAGNDNAGPNQPGQYPPNCDNSYKPKYSQGIAGQRTDQANFQQQPMDMKNNYKPFMQNTRMPHSDFLPSLETDGCERDAPVEPPPPPPDREYLSDNEENFHDSRVGGVAIALAHGAVLFEVAKRELHATTALKNPNRYKPTRISLVLYQHKNLNTRYHGWAEWEAKMENRRREAEKRRQEMEAQGLVPPDDGKDKGKKRKKEETEEASEPEPEPFVPPVYRYLWDTNVKHASTLTNDTVVTKWKKPQCIITGPYQKWI